jgi:predicted secreted protein
MEAEEILVIILSSFLAIFLFLAIFATIMIIKLVATLRAIAEKTDIVAGNIAAASSTLRKSAGPLAMFKTFAGFADLFSKRKRKG